MSKTQWHTYLPCGDRPVWATTSKGHVAWSSSTQVKLDMLDGYIIAWTEYTPEKPEPYQLPSPPTATSVIEAWRELEAATRKFVRVMDEETAILAASEIVKAHKKLDAARGVE